jgi:hypothetical protein
MANFKAVLSDRCMIHGCALISTRAIDARGLPARSFLSCPICNAEQIDRMKRQPGVITIEIGK